MEFAFKLLYKRDKNCVDRLETEACIELLDYLDMLSCQYKDLGVTDHSDDDYIFFLTPQFVEKFINDSIEISNAYEYYEKQYPAFSELLKEYLKAQERANWREIPQQNAMIIAKEMTGLYDEMIQRIQKAQSESRYYIDNLFYLSDDIVRCAAAINHLHYICLTYYWDYLKREGIEEQSQLVIRICEDVENF